MVGHTGKMSEDIVRETGVTDRNDKRSYVVTDRKDE
jgi:hypothetical protein